MTHEEEARELYRQVFRAAISERSNEPGSAITILVRALAAREARGREMEREACAKVARTVKDQFAAIAEQMPDDQTMALQGRATADQIEALIHERRPRRG